jgi:flagellin-like protein
MRKLLKSKKALSPVVAAIILIAVTVAVSIAVAAWMGSLTIGFMNTKEAKITSITFDTRDLGTQTDVEALTFDVTNTGTAKVNIATIRINDVTVQVGDIYNGTDGSSIGASDMPIEVATGADASISIDLAWTAGLKYSVSLFETDGTLVGSSTDTA